jgi:hypothetical protein
MSPHRYKAGDQIRILRVPPPVLQQMPAETVEIFRRAVGCVLRVEEIDEHGHLQLEVRADGSQAPDACHHTIWVEPEHVEFVSSS